jgi:Fe-S cluster biosynthesis and repair protein YggX
MLKEQREKIDVHISNLLEEEEDEKIKKYVTSTMRGDIINIKIKYEDCLEENCKGTSVPCESCGATKVDEMREKMREYTANLNRQIEDEDKKELIREDLIAYINKLNQDSRKLVTKKVTDGPLEKCEEEELKVIEDCKGPMWMLVNTTIFDTVDSVTEVVSVMDDMLKTKRGEYCNSDDTPPPPSTTNCEWEEYEQTKAYLEEVDKTIQENLFKKADDQDAKKDTLLGFVQIQSLFDGRVRKLFEDEVRCPEELNQIKKTYMPILNKCMIEFMRPSVDFSTMSRFQRISCIKELRNDLEDRTAKLLQFELNDSLSAIKAPGA